MADDQAVASPAAPLEAAPLDALSAAQQMDTSAHFGFRLIAHLSEQIPIQVTGAGSAVAGLQAVQPAGTALAPAAPPIYAAPTPAQPQDKIN